MNKDILKNKAFIKDNKVIKIVSMNTRSKLSLRSQGVKVKVFDKEYILVYYFPTITTAAKHLGVNRATISKILNKGISYGKYIYKFENKDIKILIYNINYELIETLENAKKTSIVYNIPSSTLSNYIKSGKLYKNKFYFIKKEY